MTFLELAVKVLKEAQVPLTAEEIWEYAKAKGYEKEVGTQGKTPWMSVSAQLYVSVRDKKDSPFVKTDSKPRRFFLRSLLKEVKDIDKLLEEQARPEAAKLRFEFLEKDLHQFLAYFAFYFQKTYTKTIEHAKSERREFGEWMHPDMVGCYFPIDEWRPEVLEFSSSLGNVPTKVSSYEIKRELSFSNLRESFFQTVSNSSWANESYLVAAHISNDEDFQDELRRLSSSFGIGVIRLDIEDPDSSEILLPARLKDTLDWETINKLSMNRDFRDFLRRVRIDLSSKEIRKEKYDKIVDKESLVKAIRLGK
jgi:hypothetical protein